MKANFLHLQLALSLHILEFAQGIDSIELQ